MNSFYGDIQNLTYQFDSIGNLVQRTSARTSQYGVAVEYIEEGFTHDNLNRLLDAVTTDGLATQKVISTGYDALGNIDTKSDVGSYSYDGVRNAGRHAVTGAGAVDYGYDQYGNMTSRGNTQLAYDVFNKPTQIGSAFIAYGPDHSRFAKTEGNTITYYFAGGRYEEIVDGNHVEKKSYVGGYVLHTQTANNAELVYMHTDHLGSIVAYSDTDGKFYRRACFDAWGQKDNDLCEPELLAPSLLSDLPTTRGFTGHEHLDNYGLIHMNGRVYDPLLGRVLSADILIQAPFNTQSYNRYSYVFNNPLSLVDPSGYAGEGTNGHQVTTSEVAEEEVIVYGPPEPPPTEPQMNRGQLQASMMGDIARQLSQQINGMVALTQILDSFSVRDAFRGITYTFEFALKGAEKYTEQQKNDLKKEFRAKVKKMSNKEKLKKIAGGGKLPKGGGAALVEISSSVPGEEGESFASYFGERVMSGQVRDDMTSGMLGLVDGVSFGFFPLLREQYGIDLPIAEGNYAYNIGDTTSFFMLSRVALKLVHKGYKQIKRAGSWRTNSPTSRATGLKMRNEGWVNIAAGVGVIAVEEVVSQGNGLLTDEIK